MKSITMMQMIFALFLFGYIGQVGLFKFMPFWCVAAPLALDFAISVGYAYAKSKAWDLKVIYWVKRMELKRAIKKAGGSKNG